MFKIAVATLLTATLARAESFYCKGVGKYAEAFTPQVVTPQWPDKSQIVLMDTITKESGTKIFIDLDKSQSYRTEYLAITVLNMTEQGTVSSHYAKGSTKYELILGEKAGGDERDESAITCLPLTYGK